MLSQRQLRVGEQVRHEIVDVLQHGRFHVDDPALMETGHITISEVRMTPDLKQARAYVSTLGGNAHLNDMIDALNHAAPFFQRELGKKLKIKFTPRITFVRDDSFDTAQRIDELIKNAPVSGQ